MFNFTKDDLTRINEYDFKTLFGLTKTQNNINNIIVTAFKDDDEENKLNTLVTQYFSFDPDLWAGDIIKATFDKTETTEWIVTCPYIDGMYDLISRTGKIERMQTGFWMKEFEKIGSLERKTETRY